MIKKSRTVLAILIFGYTFLFTPLVLLIINSFGDSEIPGIWTHFTLKWFRIALEDHELLHAVIISLKIAIISATVSVILGLISALATSKPQNYLGKHFLENVLIIPIVMPEIIVGFSLLMMFLSVERLFNIQISRGIMTVCIGHIVTTMAYAHMNIRSKLIVMDKSIDEAALNLGAKPIVAFWKIKLPMLKNTILATWILAFTISLDDLVIASFLTGPGSTTLPLLIFSNVRVGITPMINAFATMFILIVILCIIVIYFCSHKKN